MSSASDDYVFDLGSLSDHFTVFNESPVCTDGDVKRPLQTFVNFKICLGHVKGNERLMADFFLIFLYCILYSMCTEFRTQLVLFRQNWCWDDICVVRSLKVRSYTTPSTDLPTAGRTDIVNIIAYVIQTIKNYSYRTYSCIYGGSFREN